MRANTSSFLISVRAKQGKVYPENQTCPNLPPCCTAFLPSTSTSTVANHGPDQWPFLGSDSGPSKRPKAITTNFDWSWFWIWKAHPDTTLVLFEVSLLLVLVLKSSQQALSHHKFGEYSLEQNDVHMRGTNARKFYSKLHCMAWTSDLHDTKWVHSRLNSCIK